jgi:hypothetical protein
LTPAKNGLKKLLLPLYNRLAEARRQKADRRVKDNGKETKEALKPYMES